MNIKKNYKQHKKEIALGAIIFLYFLGALILFAWILPANNLSKNNESVLASTPTLVFENPINKSSLKNSTIALEKIITEEVFFADDPQSPDCELADDVCGVYKKYIDKINDDFEISAKNLADKKSCSNFPVVGSQDYQAWKAGIYQIPFLIDKDIAAGSYNINRANWIKLAGAYEYNFYCCLPYLVK